MYRFAAISAGVATAVLTAGVAAAQEPATGETPAAEIEPAANAETPAEPAPVPLGDGGVGPGGGDDDDDGGKGDGDGGKGDGGKGDGGKDKPGRRPLKLLRADAKPSKAWFKGRDAVFRFEIDGRRKRNVIVQVKRKGPDPAIVRRFELTGVRPNDTRTVAWNGRTDGKKFARQGNYKFKVRARHGDAAITKDAAGKPEAGFFKHKFPIRGAHSYGAGLGDGRGHRGVDVFAGCGTKLQAARAGKVQFKAFQKEGAGHYLVIDGKGTGKDYVYMHLQHASPLAEGDKVRTGQPIGNVGETGNAQGCHLHFELWSAPGWYEGGDFLDPVPKMRAWDRWS